MEVRTYTNIWNEEKKLYSIYEWQLPTPVGFRQIGLFALGLIVWVPLMLVLHVPISNAFTFIIWFGPPVLLAILGNKPMFEDKTIFQFASSRLGFMMEPKTILDGEGMNLKAEKLITKENPVAKAGKHTLAVEIWEHYDNESDK